MKRIRLFYCTLFIFTFSFWGFSQDIPAPFAVLDQAQIEVKYRFEMQKKVMGASSMVDTMILLSGEKYSLSYMYSTYYSDSIKNSLDGDKIILQQFKKGMQEKNASLFIEPHTLPEYVYIDWTNRQVTVYESKNFYVPVLYEEPLEQISWIIKDSDTKSIAGYVACRAVCDFRGRKFEAWFTKDLPSDIGPWKFEGLPGVILEIYDDAKEFVWTAIDVKTHLENPIPIRWIQFFDTPFTKIDRISYLKDLRQMLEGGAIEKNQTIQTIIQSGVRTRYRQRRAKSLEHDFLECDYIGDDHRIDSLSSTTSPIEHSQDSLSIPGQPSSDHLLLKYQYIYQKDTLNGSTFRPDIHIMQIYPDKSVYYSLRTYEMKSVYGSKEGRKKWQELFQKGMTKVNAGGSLLDFMNNLPRLGDQELIIKGDSPEFMKVYDTIGNEQYFYEDEVHLDWTLSDSIKVVLGYECQMATTTFRGRTWVAWFAYEIPVSNGPWKLYGLPGLICEAYDIQKQYYYMLTGLEQKKALLDYEVLIDKSASSIEREKLQKSKVLYSQSGGELSLLGTSSKQNNYPKQKEIE